MNLNLLPKVTLALVSAFVGSLATYVILHYRSQPRTPYADRPLARLDENCRKYGEEHRKRLGLKTDFDEVVDFYSHKLDTCVEAQSSSIENSFLVKDISGGFMKTSLPGLGDFGQGLFDCDSSGVDHAILTKIREHHGNVDKVPYSEWMDDFNGGPPRTVKTAEKWYTRMDCEEFFQKELKELR